MAILSSHFLNGAAGTHAGEVSVSVWLLSDSQERHLVFESKSKVDGRFEEEIPVDTDANYEMIVDTGA